MTKKRFEQGSDDGYSGDMDWVWTVIAFVLAIGFIVLLTRPAWASGASVNAPHGYVTMCGKTGCYEVTPADVKNTSDLRATLLRAARHAYRDITPVDEAEGQDVWRMPYDLKGDCEDMALYIRLRLVQAGVPAGALRLGTGSRMTSKGRVGHTFILVKIRGETDMLVDQNGLKNPYFSPWRNLKHESYTYISPETGYNWVTLDN